MRGVESDNDRLRLGKCSNKFGIPLGLHYLCLAAKIGCASEMLK